MPYLHELHSFAYNTRLSLHGDVAVGNKTDSYKLILENLNCLFVKSPLANCSGR